MVVKWLLQKWWITVFNGHKFCVRKCEAIANGYRDGAQWQSTYLVDVCVIPGAGKEMKEKR